MSTSGTIFDIKKYAIHDGPGIRTTIFFKGCPLHCWWCHNPESIKLEPETVTVRIQRKYDGSTDREEKRVIGSVVTVDHLIEDIIKDVIFYDQSGGGVTISGGEPMMQMEFLYMLLKGCKREGIHTALDTSGYAPEEDFKQIYNLVDLFLYDLKIMDDEAHVKYTGVSNKLILENLVALTEKGEKVVPRIPLIPDITDTDDNIEATIKFLEPLGNVHEISLLPYNRIGEDKFMRYNLTNKLGKLRKQTEAEIEATGKRFESSGYMVKIGG